MQRFINLIFLLTFLGCILATPPFVSNDDQYFGKAITNGAEAQTLKEQATQLELQAANHRNLIFEIENRKSQLLLELEGFTKATERIKNTARALELPIDQAEVPQYRNYLEYIKKRLITVRDWYENYSKLEDRVLQAERSLDHEIRRHGSDPDNHVETLRKGYHKALNAFKQPDTSWMPAAASGYIRMMTPTYCPDRDNAIRYLDTLILFVEQESTRTF
jgi:hypothetical protein